ncbi:MAG: tRNA (guanosine(46)-N7)-methyltransferase TrmB [Devosiaceae bacterium]|nr:tRNA (guanosine(46)-N7)-methyltransferase TrmB [Devosiaceae bacterium]
MLKSGQAPKEFQEPRAFFGRKSGKRMLRGQQELFDELLPNLEINLANNNVDIKEIFPNREKIILEIGYGGGEHLARKAIENPEIGFIGCEVFTGGIGKLLQQIKTHNIKNIRLFSDDAIKLLNAMDKKSIDEIYLLYPDPWPKKKHNKRRFVSKMTLDEMAKALKPKGLFHFATDIEDYANWTLAHILRHKDFTHNLNKPLFWHKPFIGWQATRYEKKAKKEGRDKSFYFTFEKHLL